MNKITTPTSDAIHGEVSFDRKRGKVVIEFAEPKWGGKTKDMHIGKPELLKEIGERAFRAIELLGQEFYTRGGVIITAEPNEIAEMTVHIIL